MNDHHGHVERFGLRAVVLGGTGLVGSALLAQLLEDEAYGEVISLSRRKGTFAGTKLRQEIFDFENRASYAEQVRGDVLFLSLGTTLKAAGSKAAQARVDHDYQLWAAEAAHENGVGTCVLVSSMGADANSSFFYPRIKGELEERIQGLGFERTLILRPTLLDGPRKEKRRGEGLALGFLRRLPHHRLLEGAIPIHADTVARAMGRGPVILAQGQHLWGSAEIRQNEKEAGAG